MSRTKLPRSTVFRGCDYDLTFHDWGKQSRRGPTAGPYGSGIPHAQRYVGFSPVTVTGGLAQREATVLTARLQRPGAWSLCDMFHQIENVSWGPFLLSCWPQKHALLVSDISAGVAHFVLQDRQPLRSAAQDIAHVQARKTEFETYMYRALDALIHQDEIYVEASFTSTIIRTPSFSRNYAWLTPGHILFKQ